MTTRTARGRREDERMTFASYLQECPTTKLMASVSNRWITLIVCTLGSHPEPLRYNQLGREIPGVSQKMLTQTLRTLEREGFVARTVTLAVPVQVSYELTELGRSLQELLYTFRDWADANIPRVDQARARYDTAG